MFRTPCDKQLRGKASTAIILMVGLLVLLAGSGDFTLTVNGANFVNESRFRINGSARPTTFIDGKQLTAQIAETDILNGGVLPISVTNAVTAASTSNHMSPLVTHSGPIIYALAPASAIQGQPGFDLTVTGTGFISGSVVRLNGLDHVTTFISGITLSANITAADLVLAGTFPITVVNPPPGGGSSNAVAFTVEHPSNPVPYISSLSPASKIAGEAGFTLTVNGGVFSNTSIVRWNFSDRPTTFVNSAQVTAQILSADIATAGVASVTIFNPVPGGGTSNAVSFMISPNPTGVAPQCPGLSAEAATPGITKFNTVKSQLWHNDGLWWGAFSDNATGIFFYTLANNAATKGPIIDTNINGIPDVLWDGTNLFVAVWKSVSLATLYKYDYNSVTKTHTLVSGFPVPLPLIGGATSALVLDKDSTGKLWATYTGTQGGLADGKIRVIWSTTSDHQVWDTTGTTIESGLVPNTPEISAVVHFGGNKIGIAWSNRPAKEIAFRYHVDGQPETTWSAKEIIDSGLGPRGLGPVADDHLSIKAAPDGRLFLVAKDHDNDGTPAHQNEARIWLYQRSASGVWGSKTVIQPDLNQLPVRPVLLLDVTANLAYVIFHDSVGDLNFITHSPMDNPAFNLPCAFSSTLSSNPTSTKQNVTSLTGLMAAASTGATSTNEIVFRRVDLTAPDGFECDVNGDGIVSIADWVRIGRFAAGFDTPTPGEFQRADSAPQSTLGNGIITISDWVQCGRYAAGLDPLVPAGGPTMPVGGPTTIQSDSAVASKPTGQRRP
jgi:hypothetical protein